MKRKAKESRDEVIHIRVTSNLKRRLEERAARESRTLSQMAAMLIERALA